MKRQFRLTRTTELQRTRRQGQSYACPLIVMVAMKNEGPASKVGVVAGKSVGGAVQRNRVKRQIRACLEEFFPEIKPGWNLLFIARQPLIDAPYTEIRNAILSLLKRAGVYGCAT